ncbi:uncharacterized protein VTP21DRAFT_5233 [Calcarisporiella thermophila]|uniref:uncharacterized protein n=1 Tax=Calcarisporiella thermophila TaxID=911321 RepID=UPI0037440616
MQRAIDAQDSPRYHPHPLPENIPPHLAGLQVKRYKYTTSLDPRGYIPVYEYNLTGPASSTPVLWDRELGEVHFTGIWKALGNAKTDIVRMIEANPDLIVKKIRGGFLKIQGTWIQYDWARLLAIRTCYPIRYELIPLFGPQFPEECLPPSHPDFGNLILTGTLPHPGRRRRSSPQVMRARPTITRLTTSEQADDWVKSPSMRLSSPFPASRHHPYTSSPHSRLPPKPQPLHDSYFPSPQKFLGDDLSRLTASSALPRRSSFPLPPKKQKSPRGMEFLLNKEDDDEDVEMDLENGVEGGVGATALLRTRSSSTCVLASSSSSSSSPSPPVVSVSTKARPSMLTPAISPTPSSDSSASSPNLDSAAASIYLSPSYFVDEKCSSSSLPSPRPSVSFVPKRNSLPTLLSNDAVETMTCSLLLQQLSRDDGRRPFSQLQKSLPETITFGGRDYQVIWRE